MNRYDFVLDKNPEQFEDDRNSLLEKMNESLPILDEIEKNMNSAKECGEVFSQLNCIDKIEKLDSVVFMSIDVFEVDNEKRLFGEISKVIESAIESEINEILNINQKVASRQAMPETIIIDGLNKKNTIIQDVILEAGSEDHNKTLFTVRCMETYCEMLQTAEAISARSEKKAKENQQFLYFIGTNLSPNKNLPESNIGEAMSYTIAVVANIRDGTVPDVNIYKEKIANSINMGINSLVQSQDIKSSIEVFDGLKGSLSECRQQLGDFSGSKQFEKAISAIEEICERKVEEVKGVGFEL